MATTRTDLESPELLRRIREEIKAQIQTPTPEWKTAEEWGATWGLQRAQTNRLLSQAVRLGMMESRTFRLPMPIRGSYPVPHYRELPKP